MADQADLLGLLGVDVLGGEDELHGVGHPHDAGQALGAAEAGGDAQTHLGLAELGLLAGQADVTGHGQLTAAAQSEAVHRGDDGLGEVLQLQEHTVAVHTELLGLYGGKILHLADVGPGHKGAARAGEDEHQHLVVGLRRVQDGVQILQHLVVQGVQGLGTVHGDDPDGAALFKVYKSHGKVPPFEFCRYVNGLDAVVLVSLYNKPPARARETRTFSQLPCAGNRKSATMGPT